MPNVKPYAKAIIAALAAMLAVAGTVVGAGGGITVTGWLGIVAAGLSAFTAVWVTPWMPTPTNTPAPVPVEAVPPSLP